MNVFLPIKWISLSCGWPDMFGFFHIFWARRPSFPRCTTRSLGTWPRLLDHTASFLCLEFFVLCPQRSTRVSCEAHHRQICQLNGTLSLIMAFTCRPSPYWLFSFFSISSSLRFEAELQRCLIHITYIVYRGMPRDLQHLPGHPSAQLL